MSTSHGINPVDSLVNIIVNIHKATHRVRIFNKFFKVQINQKDY